MPLLPWYAPNAGGDVPYWVGIAFDSNPADELSDSDFSDVTDYTYGYRIRRGRNFELDRIQAGTLQLRLIDKTGRFDPSNVDGPYYGSILPLKRVRVRRHLEGTTYRRFDGVIERWVRRWDKAAGVQYIDVQAVDAFEVLNNVGMSSGYATLTTALAGSNNDLTFTARRPGIDTISVTYEVAGTNTVLDSTTNDPDGTIGDVALQLTGAGSVGGFRPRGLVLPGSGGITDPGGDQSPISPLKLSGTEITVAVGTDGGGAATSTASQVKALLDADTEIMKLVSVELAAGNTGAGVVTAMAKTYLTGGKWDAELSGVRIGRALDAASWPAAMRVLDTGVYDVAPAGFDNAPTLPHLQDAADSELGYVFADTSFRVVFHDGQHRVTDARSVTSQATFTDATTGFRFRDITPSLDRDRLWNDVTVTAGGTAPVPQSVEDATSISAYLRRTLSRNTVLANDTDAAAVGTALLEAYKTPVERFDEIELQDIEADGWAAAVLGREIGDLVTKNISPPGHSTTVSYEAFVEAIEDEMEPGLPYTVRFQTSPQSASAAGGGGGGGGGGTAAGAVWDSSGDDFTLDDAGLGVLG